MKNIFIKIPVPDATGFLSKGLLVMKLTGLLLLVSALQISAHDVDAQTITYVKKHATLEKLFRAIRKQTGYEFLYNSAMVDGIEIQDPNLKKVPLEEALSDLFKDQPLAYTIIGKTIVVRERTKDPQKASEKQQLLFAEIHGTVKDSATGNPLVGVTVKIKGSTIGTTTDAQGSFVVNAPENAILEISYVGYNDKEVRVDGRTSFDIRLSTSATGLNQVVVVGYGTQRKKDVTSSIASASAKELKDKPVGNFAQALAGQVSGVNFSNTNGAPGGGSQIIIRGVNSINASNDPLIVVNGFPLNDAFDKNVNPLNSINTNDIETIQVLKDATATAIYGTRGANGVIIIITKKGTSGKPTFNINMSTGFSDMINRIDVLDRGDFLKYIDDARADAYVVEDPNYGTDNPSLPQWKWSDDPELRIKNWSLYSSHASAMQDPQALFYRWITVTDTIYNSPYNTDWQDVISRKGKVNNINLSAAGGTENFKYRISGGYLSQEGIIKHSGYERYSFQANLDLKVNNYLKVGLFLSPSLEKFQKVPRVEGSTNNSPIYASSVMPPIWSPTDESGKPIYYGNILLNPWDWNFIFAVNPLSGFLQKSKSRKLANLMSIYADINILDNLKLRTQFNTNFVDQIDNDFTPTALPTTNAKTSRSQGSNINNRELDLNFQTYLTYSKLFNRHSVNAMLGYSVENTTLRSSYLRKYDFPTDLVTSLNQAITILNAQNDARTNRSSQSLIGMFARLQYNYANKYYLTGSIRRDGSSKFGENNKWGVFPSFSMGWRISEESFFASLKKYVNDLKLRGGWGKIGNAGIGNYLPLSKLQNSTYAIGRGSDVLPTFVPGNIANPVLGWETTKEVDLGVDMEILNSRIGVTVDYFRRMTSDMLFSVPLPGITGFASYTTNLGLMRNRGLEYSLETRNLVGAFKWNTHFNLSYYRNKVIDIGNDKRPLIDGNSYTAEGKPIAEIWGSQFLGPYRDWEDVKTSPIVNANNANWRFRSSPGTPKLADINGDGIIDGSDKTVIGSPVPDFIWGITNNFAFKGFDLAIKINGTQGGDILMSQNSAFYARGDGRQNTTVDYYENYWRPDRHNAKYTAPSRKQYDNTDLSGSLVYKGTFVSISNINLGYSFSDEILKKIYLSNLRVYLSVQNAFFFTKFPGYNPQANYGYNSALRQGINRGAYPMSRTVSFGLNVSL